MTVEGTVPVLFSDDDEADVENDPLNSIYWRNVIDNTSVDSKDDNLKADLISCGQSTSYMNIIKEDPVVSAMIREKAKTRENVLLSPLARRCNPDHDEYDMNGLIANDSEQKQRRYEMTSTRSPLKQPNAHYSFFLPSEVEPRSRHPHMTATPLTEKEITLARREKLIRSILNRGDDPEFCPSTTPRRQRISWLPSPPKRMLRPRKKEWSDDDDIPLTELSKQIHGNSKYDLEAELALRRVLSETTPSRRGRTATRSTSTAPSTSTRKRMHSSQRVTTPSRPRNTRRSCVLILEQEEEVDYDEEKEQAQRRSAKRRRLAHSPSPCEWIPPNEALASARRRRIRKEMEGSESEDEKTLSELRAQSQRSAERAKRRRQPVNYSNMDWTPEK